MNTNYHFWGKVLLESEALVTHCTTSYLFRGCPPWALWLKWHPLFDSLPSERGAAWLIAQPSFTPEAPSFTAMIFSLLLFALWIVCACIKKEKLIFLSTFQWLWSPYGYCLLFIVLWLNINTNISNNCCSRKQVLGCSSHGIPTTSSQSTDTHQADRHEINWPVRQKLFSQCGPMISWQLVQDAVRL